MATTTAHDERHHTSELRLTVKSLKLPLKFDPPHVTLRVTAMHDPRVGHLIGQDLKDGEWPDIAIMGFPCDNGVRRNHGREGAAMAPDVIRDMLYRCTPDRAPGFTRLLGRTADFGNLQLAGDLESSQDRLGRMVGECLKHNTVPIVLGGGHETAFGHFLGYVHAGQDVTIINWDQHPDVRRMVESHPHSGSPFRQAIEHPSKRLQEYRVAGLLAHSSAPAHVEYVEQHGGHVWWREEVTPQAIASIVSTTATATMATFDVDAVDQAFAPGVSAPAVGGLTSELWLRAAAACGANPRVTSLDLCEMNPRFDRDGQTARLAALTLWTFLKGVASRQPGAAS
jgi:formiminoglutamase